jgi:prolipoprotein diacylglyceryltransferase
MRSILFEWGPLQVPAYGFMIMLGFMGAMLLAYFRAKLAGIRPEIIIDMGIYSMITGIMGSRLWYIVQYRHLYSWELVHFQEGILIFAGIAGFFLFLASYRNLDFFFYGAFALLARGFAESHSWIVRTQGKLHLADLGILGIFIFLAYRNRERYRHFFKPLRKGAFLSLLVLIAFLFSARLGYMGIHYVRYYQPHWVEVETQDQKKLSLYLLEDSVWKNFLEKYPDSTLALFKDKTSRHQDRQKLGRSLQEVFKKKTAAQHLQELGDLGILARVRDPEKAEESHGDAFALFKIWKGGMVSFGGLFFASFVVCIVVAKYRLPLAKVIDLATPGVPFAIGITRAGCFMNGCCFGGVPQSDFYLGVTYPHHSLCWAHHLKKYPDLIHPRSLEALTVHAAQFYEALSCFLIFLFLTWWYPRRRKEGEMLLLLGIFYGIARFLVEQTRDDTPIVAWGRNIGELTGLGLSALSLLFFLNIRFGWVPVLKYFSFLDPLRGAEVSYSAEKK